MRSCLRGGTDFDSCLLVTIPTVGDAIEALNSLCDDLAVTLKQIVDLSAELSSRDHIRVDNIQEVGGHVAHRRSV